MSLAFQCPSMSLEPLFAKQVVGLIRADGRGGFRRARVIRVEGGCRRGAGKNAAHVNTRKVLLRATFCGLDGSDYGICKLGSVNLERQKERRL